MFQSRRRVDGDAPLETEQKKYGQSKKKEFVNRRHDGRRQDEQVYSTSQQSLLLQVGWSGGKSQLQWCCCPRALETVNMHLQSKSMELYTALLPIPRQRHRFLFLSAMEKKEYQQKQFFTSQTDDKEQDRSPNPTVLRS
jgi:hypothetical protein